MYTRILKIRFLIHLSSSSSSKLVPKTLSDVQYISHSYISFLKSIIVLYIQERCEIYHTAISLRFRIFNSLSLGVILCHLHRGSDLGFGTHYIKICALTSADSNTGISGGMETNSQF